MVDRGLSVFGVIKEVLIRELKNSPFDSFSNDEKESIIISLHREFTNPSNEARNRMQLFAIKSPEILKPIIESMS